MVVRRGRSLRARICLTTYWIVLAPRIVEAIEPVLPERISVTRPPATLIATPAAAVSPVRTREDVIAGIYLGLDAAPGSDAPCRRPFVSSRRPRAGPTSAAIANGARRGSSYGGAARVAALSGISRGGCHAKAPAGTRPHARNPSESDWRLLTHGGRARLWSYASIFACATGLTIVSRPLGTGPAGAPCLAARAGRRTPDPPRSAGADLRLELQDEPLGRAAGVDEDDLAAGVAEPPRTAGDRAPSPVVKAEVNRPVEGH